MARLVVLWFYFPKFLDAYAVGLVAGFIAQIEFLEQRLASATRGTLPQKMVCVGVQFEPGLIITRLFAVLADTHVTASRRHGPGRLHRKSTSAAANPG